MNLGDVKIAVGLDVEIINGILVHLYEASAIPPEINLGIEVGGETINLLHARLLQPRVVVKYDGDTPRLGALLTGEVSQYDNDPVPLSAWIEILPQVVETEGEAPAAGIKLGLMEDANPGWFEWVFNKLLAKKLEDALAGVKLPLFEGLITQLEPAFEEPPARDTWACGFYLAKPSTLERQYVEFPRGQPDKPYLDHVEHRTTVVSLLFTLALPGEDARLPGDRSIVPRGTGLQMVIAQTAMDMILGAQTTAMTGQEIEGATIKSLQMRMHPLGIEMHGKAEKDVADINWDGVLLLFWKRWYFLDSGAMRHYKGGGRVDVFTSGIDVDVNLPWWVKLIEIVSYVIGPIGWILNSIFLAPQLQAAGSAPTVVRAGLSDVVGAAFNDMLNGVASIAGVAPVPLKMYGRDSWVMGGHFAYTALLMAGKHDAVFEDVVLDHFIVPGAEGDSVGYFVLNTGHDLSPEEAGELMKAKILRVPGYHGVLAPYGHYVRSTANKSEDDNLVEPATTDFS